MAREVPLGHREGRVVDASFDAALDELGGRVSLLASRLEAASE